jgi:hypothetical protein
VKPAARTRHPGRGSRYGLATSIIPDLMPARQHSFGTSAGYGSVPPMKMVPPCGPTPRGWTRKTTS